jgi:hypothetical protein
VSVTVAINRFVDFEALQGIMQDGHSDVVQIGRGRMSGSLTHISAGPSFGISSGNFSRGARLRGVTSQRRFMLGMVLATDGEATAWQQEVESGDFLMVAPGQERYSVYQDATKFACFTPRAGGFFSLPGQAQGTVWSCCGRESCEILIQQPLATRSGICRH